MGTTLTGTTPQDTYDSLIKVTDNGPLSGTAKYLSDGLGNDSALAVSTSKVGVGTASLSLGKLVVKDNAFQYIAEPTDTATYGYLGIGHFTNGAFIGTTAGSNTVSDVLRFGTSGTERLRITSAGNIGIGTSAPDSKLRIQNDNATVPSLIIRDGGTPTADHIRVSSSTYGDAFFVTAIGNVGVGTSSVNGNDLTGLRVQGNNRIILGYTTAGAGAGTIGHFRRDNDGSAIQFVYNSWETQVGTITVNSTSTSYNTSSDYRLKENVVEIADALERIDALNPCRFNFISNPDKVVDGFLAHEVQEVVPEAVTGVKDATKMVSIEVSPAVYETIVHEAEEAVFDEEGNEISPAKEEWTEQVLISEAVYEQQEVPDYQAIDQSKIVPLLVAGLKEANAIIKSLKSRIEALEA